MDASILDLRYKMREVLKALGRREKVRILYHGKIRGEIVPPENQVCGGLIKTPPTIGISVLEKIQHLNLNVEPVNDAPTLTSVQVISFDTDSSRQSPAPVITLRIHAHDPESDSITRNVSGLSCLIDLTPDTCQLRYNSIPPFGIHSF